MAYQTFCYLILYCLFFSNCFAYQYYLSVCTIFRDEAPYLKEWIEFHRLIGVEHFYLCNHNSKDNYFEILQPYIDRGIVELSHISDSPNADMYTFCFIIQPGWYNECINKAKGVSKWVAFIDADEFICPVERNSLSEFLKDYEEFAGIGVNWFMFGTSHISKIDTSDLMIEKLTSCASINHFYNTYIKYILQPQYVINFATNPHLVNFVEGYYGVDTNKSRLQVHQSLISPPIIDRLRLNHYWTRDEDYFWNTKIPRQLQLYGQAETAKQYYSDFNQEKDFIIQRFVPEIRKRMGLD